MALKGPLTTLLALLIAALAADKGLAKPSTTDCSAKPLTADQAVELTACKVLIVGGGPGGLFSAYFLRSLGRQICVVEKKTEWGGKMQATEPPRQLATPGAPQGADPNAIGTCGLRINQAFADQRCLASQLGIQSQESAFDTIFNARGEWHRSTQAFLTSASGGSGINSFPGLRAANPDDDDLQSSMLEYAFVANSSTVNPVTGQSPHPHPSARCATYRRAKDYLIVLYGQVGYDFLLAGNSFRNDWESELDVCGRTETNFYPRGGFRPLYRELRRRITAAGVRLFAASPIMCLSDITPASGTKSRYAALTPNGRGWRAERLIINPVPTDVLKIKGSLGERLSREPVLNSIQPIKVAVYNAYWPTRWWDKYATRSGRNFRLVTPSDSRCLVRSEFPGNPSLASVNSSRPVYTDDPKCIAKWESLYRSGGLPAVRRAVVEALQSFFPNERIPQPLPGGDAFYLPFASWHYLKQGAAAHNVTVQRVADWALAPLGRSAGFRSSLCMVGEAFSIMGSGWSWGALQSAMRCLQANFSDLMSRAARDDMAFIRVGCQRGRTIPVSPAAAASLIFRGEARQTAGVRLPSLNPATGRPLAD